MSGVENGRSTKNHAPQRVAGHPRLLLRLVGLGCLGCLAGPVAAHAAEAIEPPPAEYASGPMTAMVLIVPDPNAVCAALLGRLRAPVRYLGCYAPPLAEAAPRIMRVADDPSEEPPPPPGLVILPPDDGSHWWATLRDHEYAHARGWRHGQAD